MSNPKKKMDLITKMMIAAAVCFLILAVSLPFQIAYMSKLLKEAAPEIKKSTGDGITFISSSWNAGQQPTPKTGE